MPASAVPHYKAQLNRARLSSDDFEEARACLEALGSCAGDVTRRALISSAIVAYARPFTVNSGGANSESTPQLSVSLSKVLDPSELELHERLLALRNEVVAHTDFDRKPVQRLQGTATGFTMQGKLFDLLSEQIDYVTFERMCGALKSHCVTDMLNLNGKIVAEEGAP
jgi:hypothetical protein